MKKLFLAASAVSLFIACTNAPDSDKAATGEAKEVNSTATGEQLMVDTSASKVEWIGTKVTGYHSGVVRVKSGELMVKDGNVTGGNFVMDMSNLSVTGPKGSSPDANNKLQGHLRSGDFFDVGAHPQATFVITEVKPYVGSPGTELEFAL